jgi:alpha 1,6-mannosyltransferase
MAKSIVKTVKELEEEAQIGFGAQQQPQSQEQKVVAEIPRIIWQTYKDKYEDLPDYAKDVTKTWVLLNEGWDYHFMNDEAAAEFVKKEYGDEWYDIWSNVPVGVMKADLWRYMVVYKYGGMYSDLDTICKVPVDYWFPNFAQMGCQFLVCVENEVHMANWTFIGAPGHPFLGHLLDMIKERFKDAQKYYDSDPHFVHALTANGIFTEAYLDFIGVESKDLTQDIEKFNASPKAQEVGLVCAPSHRFFHWEVVRHLYGSIHWNDGKYVRWIQERQDKNPIHEYDLV